MRIARSATAGKTHAWLHLAADGRIPLLELAPGNWLPESNAILWYLAEGSTLLPDSECVNSSDAVASASVAPVPALL